MRQNLDGKMFFFSNLGHSEWRSFLKLFGSPYLSPCTIMTKDIPLPKCRQSHLARLGPETECICCDTGEIGQLGLPSDSHELSPSGWGRPQAPQGTSRRWLRSPNRRHLADTTTWFYRSEETLPGHRQPRAGRGPGLSPPVSSPVFMVCSE